MRVPYGEDLAGHTGPESCVGTREGDGEALTGVRAGWALSPERSTSGTPRRFPNAEGHTSTPQGHGLCGSRGVEDPMHARKHLTREDDPLVRKPGDPRLGPPLVPARLVRVMNP